MGVVGPHPLRSCAVATMTAKRSAEGRQLGAVQVFGLDDAAPAIGKVAGGGGAGDHRGAVA